MLSSWDAVVELIKFLPSGNLKSSVEYRKVRGNYDTWTIWALNFVSEPCNISCQFI